MKKYARLLILGSLVLGLLAACAQPTPETVEVTRVVTEQEKVEVTRIVQQEVTVTEEAPASAGEVVEISYLSAGSAEVEQDWNEKWVKKFNETHDDIQINYMLISWDELMTKAQAMIAAGTPPDIAWYAPSNILEWYLGGQLEPLDDYLVEEIEMFVPPIKDPETSDIIFDGHYYGLPFCLAGIGTVVRRDMFEEAGYDLEDLEDWTWEEMEQVAQDIYKPEEDQYAYQFAFGQPRKNWAVFYPAENGFDNIADFSNREAYIQALQHAVNLFPYTPEAQLNWSKPDYVTAYINSILAMVETGTYFQGDIIRRAPEIMNAEKTAILPSPRGPNLAENSTQWYTVGWVMFEASKNKEAAAEVLRFLGSKEAVNEWPMNLAPYEGITTDDRVAASEFGEDIRWWIDRWTYLMENTKPIPQIGYAPRDEIEKNYNDVVLKLYQEEITPEEAYEELKSRIEPLTEQ
jgi:multiple sugar transport system substrate-binding protein